MRIAVLGAGVIGLTTAWALAERGHDVTIVDRQPAPGLETSYANGAQLSYAYVAPLASLSLLRKIPSLLLARDGPLRIRARLDPDLLRWLQAFLKACNPEGERRTTRTQFALAALSRLETERLATALDLSFGFAEVGKLVVFRDSASFAAARQQSEMLRALGVEQEIAAPARCLAIEPSLRIPKSDLKGGIYTPTEQVGDCAAFCRELSRHLSRRHNVTWRLNTTLRSPRLRAGRIEAISTNDVDVEADLFVLCLGSGSAAFARLAGFRLLIQPLKGYSLTLEPGDGALSLTRSVTDFDNKIVFAPIAQGNRRAVRIAGCADLVGHDPQVDPVRIATIRRLAETVLDFAPYQDGEPWAGLRPATPDSRPIIGPSPIPNLILNTGHGGLGWTLACGSARICAEIIQGDPVSL